MVSDWPVVAAALATVLLSATLLSAGPIYGEAITISAFARAMENAPAEESGASISASPRAEDFEGADLLVDAAVDVAMGGTDGRVTAIARATTRQIASHGGETDLAEVWHVEGIDELATLAEGRWPADDGPTEIAVPVAVARTLGIDVGDTLVLAARNGRRPTRLPWSGCSRSMTWTTLPGSTTSWWSGRHHQRRQHGARAAHRLPGGRGGPTREHRPARHLRVAPTNTSKSRTYPGSATP